MSSDNLLLRRFCLHDDAPIPGCDSELCQCIVIHSTSETCLVSVKVISIRPGAFASEYEYCGCNSNKAFAGKKYQW